MYLFCLTVAVGWQPLICRPLDLISFSVSFVLPWICNSKDAPWLAKKSRWRNCPARTHPGTEPESQPWNRNHPWGQFCWKRTKRARRQEEITSPLWQVGRTELTSSVHTLCQGRCRALACRLRAGPCGWLCPMGC